MKIPAEYNPNAKKEDNIFDVKRRSEISPVRPSNEVLVDSLAGEWGQTSTEQGGVLEHPKMAAIRKDSNGELEG